MIADANSAPGCESAEDRDDDMLELQIELARLLLGDPP
ncbi:hypothetical protein CCUG60885_05004 [Mycobacteroides salmoniphilum]|uniref:Uncharacterized protein n=1 Tax=Mycobacteroides salmoniphilum TaxID=404941 RepID=A0A4R8S7D2_9MYCO|nr:hypothetical protein CCUG60885_05004 [Mycobacteroides salmoniphilum]TEA00887.1 hypothetical protein CCUG60883_04537 [Mycobacteroides salmoniphilum]